MQRGIGVICALLVSRLIGYNLFVAVLFSALGLYLAQGILRARIEVSPYVFFVLVLLFGLGSEIITAMRRLCTNQENFYGAWLFFAPTLFFLFFSHGIRGTVRKIMGIGYAVLLMLLHFYAKTELAETASLSFLPMQLGLLFVTICTVKQKNDAS